MPAVAVPSDVDQFTFTSVSAAAFSRTVNAAALPSVTVTAVGDSEAVTLSSSAIVTVRPSVNTVPGSRPRTVLRSCIFTMNFSSPSATVSSTVEIVKVAAVCFDAKFRLPVDNNDMSSKSE